MLLFRLLGRWAPLAEMAGGASFSMTGSKGRSILLLIRPWTPPSEFSSQSLSRILYTRPPEIGDTFWVTSSIWAGIGQIRASSPPRPWLLPGGTFSLDLPRDHPPWSRVSFLFKTKGGNMDNKKPNIHYIRNEIANQPVEKTRSSVVLAG